MTGEEGAITVSDAPERERFELTLDGALAGFERYRRDDGEVAFLHTEVDPAFEGRGLGGVLVSGALDAVRAEGRQVLPYCPYVRRHIERHPEYLELVPPARRAEFGLGG